jgi:hypothetical protein
MRLGYRIGISLASAYALALLAGCRTSPPTEERLPPEPQAELDRLPPTPTFTADEAAFAAHLDPLSGLPIAEGELLDRPLAYVLDFDPADSLVAGLQAVEIWIEAPPAPSSDAGPAQLAWPVLALTLREPDSRPVLGPLAPARAMQADAASAFGARQLWAAGAEPSAQARLDEAGISLLGLEDSASSTAATDSLSDTLGKAYELGWSFDESLPAGTIAASLSLPHAADRATVWRYAAAFGMWNRSYAIGEALRPVRDADSGEALAARNLLLLRMDLRDGWQGEGPATLLRDGLAVEARWQRSDSDGQIRIRDAAGASLALAPGNTWIGLIDLEAPFAIAP